MGLKKEKRQVAMYERQKQVLEMKLAGATFQQISDQLKLGGAPNAYRDFKAAKTHGVKMAANEYFEVWNERYERMVLAMWKRARDGQFQAVDRILAIGRIVAELNGLNAPKRTDVSVAAAVGTVKATPEEAARLVRQFFGEHAAMKESDVAAVQESAAVAAALGGHTVPEDGDEPGELP